MSLTKNSPAFRAIPIFLFLLIPLVAFSQKKKDRKEVFIALSLNYYAPEEPYVFRSSFETDDQQIILDFITATFGTFTVEEIESIFVQRSNINDLSSQLIGVGGSVQFRKKGRIYHEIGLHQLTFNKSSFIITHTFRNGLERVVVPVGGYEQQMFTLGLRYEYGIYFGRKKSTFRFGVGGGFEPSYYNFKITPLTSNDFPINASVMTLELSLFPIFSFRLSRNLSMDIKVIPNFLFGEFGGADQENPTLPLGEGAGERDLSFPGLNLNGSIQFRYMIKETDSKGRWKKMR